MDDKDLFFVLLQGNLAACESLGDAKATKFSAGPFVQRDDRNSFT
jgi:hypothetical protein